MDIQIDLSWENSFRLADGRRDAAWVFVKYMVPAKYNGDGLWHHAWLNNTGHSLSNASGAYSLGLQSTKAVYNQTTNPALGAFVYQANPTAGAPFSQKLSLNWNYGTNKRDGVNLLSAKDSIHVRVFAVEMVYVPAGEFYLGSGGSETGGFVDAATKPVPYKVLSEQAIKIQATEGLWTNDGSMILPGMLPDLFPKGYGSFYCMKNEISQKQIVDFLNTLSPSQASFHYNGATVNRNSISYNGTDYVASAKELPCTTLTWVTLAAYLDWSGLRPMTELEFEKICRGPLVPVPNEYAWGSNSISAKSGIVGAGTSSETSASGNCTYNSSGPYRVGSSATSANNRVQAGASYYGAFDMSGNVRESVISIAQPIGQLFTGEHGNGELSGENADVAGWPVLQTANIPGTGWKGGSFHDTSTDPLRISDRSQVNNNNTLGDFGPGGRGVRSQPSILVKTDSVRGLTDASATAYGYVVQSGDETSYVSGMCWSPLTSPSLLDPYTTDGRTSGIGMFNSTLTGLSPCTSYNVRAYANGTSSGIVYGNVLTFITSQQPVTATLGGDNICEGATTTLSLKDYNFGNIQWSVSTDGTSWNSVGATGRNTSLTTPPLTPPKTYFRADISGMPCAPISSNVVAVNVTPTVGVPVFTQKIESLCQNSDDASYAATATNSTGIKFSASPVTAGEINESSGVINWDDDFYGNATIIATAQGCNGPKITNLSVAVSQSSNAGTISVGQSQICMGDQPTLTTTGSVGSLQWQVSDDKVLWVDISGATGIQYTVPTPLTKKQYYRVRATNSPCASVYSSVQTLTPLYRWFRNTTTATGVASSVQNGLANTKALLKLASPTGYGIDVDVSFPSSINSYADINVPIGAVEYCMRMNYDNSGNLKSGITKNNMWYLPAQAELMHMETARKCQGSFDGDYYWSSTESNASSAWFVDFGWLEGTTSTITKTNCSQVRCLQRNININVTTKVVSSITQTTGNSGGDITTDTPIISTGICWNLTGQPSIENHIGIIYNGAASNSFTNFLSGLTPCKTYYVRAFAVDSWGGVSYGNERSFTTDKDMVASITGNSVICAGETTILTAANAASYLWSTGETTQSITVGTAGTYSVTETSSNGCVDNTSFVLTVNPLGQVNQPSNLTVCAGSSVGIVIFSTNNFTGTTTYSWTNTNTSIGLAASGTGNIGAFTSSNSGLIPITATITVTPVYTNYGISCTGPSKTFTITVNPQAQVDQPSSQTVCKGSYVSSIGFTTANSVGSTTYSWTNSNTSIGLAASGTGNISGFTATNAGTSPLSSTITVTPTFTYNGVSCSGSAKTFTITVNPVGQVNQPSNQTVCAGSSTTAINFATVNTGGTTSYSWTNSNTSIGLASSGTGNISAFVAVNAGSTPVVATITVTPTFTNNGTSCSGTARTFTITVNPKPVMTSAGSKAICSGNSVNQSLSAGSVASTFTWVASSNDNVTGESTTIKTSATISDVLTNLTNSVQTVTYTVTPTSIGGLCVGDPQTVTVTVNPTLSFLGSSLAPICSGSSFSYTPSEAPAGTTYTWSAPVISPLGSITGGSAASGASSIYGTLTNTTSAVATASYTVTPTYSGCVGNSFTVTVTVNPNPVIADVYVNACSGEPFSVDLKSILGNVIPVGTTYFGHCTSHYFMLGNSGITDQGVFSGVYTHNSDVSVNALGNFTATSPGGCTTTFRIVVAVAPKPTASIKGDTTVCLNSPSPFVTITNPNLYPVKVTYKINNGTNQTVDVLASSEVTIPVSTSNRRTYVYSLVSVVTQNGEGCVTNLTGSATVSVDAPDLASMTNTVYVCPGGYCTSAVDPNPSYIADEWFWEVSNGTIISGQGTRNIVIQAGSSGEITIRVKMRVGDCWSETWSGKTIIVTEPEVTMAPTPSSVCIGESASVLFTNHLYYNAVVTYTERVGSGATTTKTVSVPGNGSASVSVPTSTLGTVVLTITDVDYPNGILSGCTYSTTCSIEVIACDPCNWEVKQEVEQATCDYKGTVRLSGWTCNASIYVDEKLLGTSESAWTYTAEKPGTYTFKIIDTNGCTKEVSVSFKCPECCMDFSFTCYYNETILSYGRCVEDVSSLNWSFSWYYNGKLVTHTLKGSAWGGIVDMTPGVRQFIFHDNTGKCPDKTYTLDVPKCVNGELQYPTVKPKVQVIRQPECGKDNTADILIQGLPGSWYIPELDQSGSEGTVTVNRWLGGNTGFNIYESKEGHWLGAAYPQINLCVEPALRVLRNADCSGDPTADLQLYNLPEKWFVHIQDMFDQDGTGSSTFDFNLKEGNYSVDIYDSKEGSLIKSIPITVDCHNPIIGYSVVRPIDCGSENKTCDLQLFGLPEKWFVYNGILNIAKEGASQTFDIPEVGIGEYEIKIYDSSEKKNLLSTLPVSIYCSGK